MDPCTTNTSPSYSPIAHNSPWPGRCRCRSPRPWRRQWASLAPRSSSSGAGSATRQGRSIARTSHRHVRVAGWPWAGVPFRSRSSSPRGQTVRASSSYDRACARPIDGADVGGGSGTCLRTSPPTRSANNCSTRNRRPCGPAARARRPSWLAAPDSDPSRAVRRPPDGRPGAALREGPPQSSPMGRLHALLPSGRCAVVSGQRIGAASGGIGDGSSVVPIRERSTDAAQERPSAIAHTMRLWPRPMSPHTNTPSRLVV
jgi:hypothetical protein